MRWRWLLIPLCLLSLASSCAPSPSPAASPTASATPTLGQRPASPVRITILQPVSGAIVRGGTVHILIGITGGRVVQTTSTTVLPTEGHVHLYLQNELVYMNYTLEQDLPVRAGVQYVLHAEFVASDHFPFTPRDVTPDVFFTAA